MMQHQPAAQAKRLCMEALALDEVAQQLEDVRARVLAEARRLEDMLASLRPLDAGGSTSFSPRAPACQAPSMASPRALPELAKQPRPQASPSELCEPDTDEEDEKELEELTLRTAPITSKGSAQAISVSLSPFAMRASGSSITHYSSVSDHLADRFKTNAAIFGSTTRRTLMQRANTAQKIILHAAATAATTMQVGSKSSVDAEQHAYFFHRLRYDLRHQTLVVDSLMSIVILANTAVIGISLDLKPQWGGWAFVDAIFAVLFLAEVWWKMRVLGVRNFFIGFDSKWHIFETTLALLAAFEVVLQFAQSAADDSDSSSQISLLRIVRLLRVTRVVRICRLEMFQDLMIMINGTLAGFRTLFWAIVLIFVPLYAVALMLREMLKGLAGGGAESFQSVPSCFLMVFRAVVTNDDADETGRPVFLRLSQQHGWVYGFLHITTIMMICFGLFNVIVAIFVDNVLTAAKFNDSLKMQNRLRDQRFFADKMAELTELIWQTCPNLAGQSSSNQSGAPSGRGSLLSVAMEEMGWVGSAKNRISADSILNRAMEMELSRDNFDQLRGTRRFGEILCDLDVSDEDQLYLFDTLDADGSGSLDLGELLEGIAKLRGEARRSDIVALTLTINAVQQDLKTYISTSWASIERLERLLQAVRKSVRQSTKSFELAKSFRSSEHSVLESC